MAAIIIIPLHYPNACPTFSTMAGARKPTHFVVTGGRTDDAAPIYRTADGGWSIALAEAAFLPTKDEAEALAKQAAGSEQRMVCDPYVFPVHVSAEGIDALSARERIRSTGPTVRVRRPD
jgi:hypothetical protein